VDFEKIPPVTNIGANKQGADATFTKKLLRVRESFAGCPADLPDFYEKRRIPTRGRFLPMPQPQKLLEAIGAARRAPSGIAIIVSSVVAANAFVCRCWMWGRSSGSGPIVTRLPLGPSYFDGNFQFARRDCSFDRYCDDRRDVRRAFLPKHVCRRLDAAVEVAMKTCASGRFGRKLWPVFGYCDDLAASGAGKRSPVSVCCGTTIVWRWFLDFVAAAGSLSRAIDLGFALRFCGRDAGSSGCAEASNSLGGSNEIAIGSTVWDAGLRHGLALFVVIGLASMAGREAAKSLLDFTSLAKRCERGVILAQLLALGGRRISRLRLGSSLLTPFAAARGILRAIAPGMPPRRAFF